jgi:hypothetical protein
MKRRLLDVLAIVSLLLCVAVGVLWARGRGGADEAEWKYNRWRADRGAASHEVDLSSGERIGVAVRWAYAPPPHPAHDDLFYYYVSADRSGGRPRLTLRHRRYKPEPDSDAFRPTDYGDGAYSGWGPLRWYGEDRSRPADGYYARGLRVGVSHWLVASPLLVPPLLWLRRSRRTRRARKIGTCPACGYDLRATPDRCPECGAVPGIG